MIYFNFLFSRFKMKKSSYIWYILMFVSIWNHSEHIIYVFRHFWLDFMLFLTLKLLKKRHFYCSGSLWSAWLTVISPPERIAFSNFLPDCVAFLKLEKKFRYGGDFFVPYKKWWKTNKLRPQYLDWYTVYIFCMLKIVGIPSPWLAA